MSDQYSLKATELLLKTLDPNQPTFVTVRSDSMAPLLRRGDEIQLAPVTSAGPNIGDVIVFGELEDLVAHRFWGKQEIAERTYLLTRGDRLARYDPLTPENMLRAAVVGRRRSGRLLILNQGSGASLNRRLIRLARLEAQVMQIPLPTSHVGPSKVAQYGLVRRIVRRLLYTIARLLTWLAGFSPRVLFNH